MSEGPESEGLAFNLALMVFLALSLVNKLEDRIGNLTDNHVCTGVGVVYIDEVWQLFIMTYLIISPIMVFADL